MIYKYGIGAALGMLLISVVWYHGYNAGVAATATTTTNEIVKAEKEKAAAIAAYEMEKEKVKVKYVDRIRTIEKAADPSGCADQPVPAGFIE